MLLFTKWHCRNCSKIYSKIKNYRTMEKAQFVLTPALPVLNDTQFFMLSRFQRQQTLTLLDNGLNVYQLETAVGAAMKCFENATGINVPRSRYNGLTYFISVCPLSSAFSFIHRNKVTYECIK